MALNKYRIKNEKRFISLPFKASIALRKLSGIDKVNNENDKFIRKESENYAFYAELLKTNQDSNKKLRNSKKNNLSNRKIILIFSLNILLYKNPLL